MPTLEKHVKRAKGSNNPVAAAMKDTATEGMKKQMDYSAKPKKSDNSPTKDKPSGKLEKSK